MFRVVRILLLGGLLGKVLGILRELVFAWLFGTGPVASAFRLAQAAFLIPLHGFVSETISGGFTPQYAAHRETDAKRSAALYSGLYSSLLLVSVIVAAILFVWADKWVATLAPGFDPERRSIATNMLQVLAFGLPAYVVSGLFASLDLALGSGRLSAARASLQSIGLIVGTLAASWLGMPSLIALGFVVAYFAFTVLGSRVVLREGLSLRPRAALTPEVRSTLLALFKIIRVLIWIPIAFQINSIIERRIASSVSPDAMAAIDYARFVTDTLVILVAMPFGLAGLSTMARMDEAEFRQAKLRAFRALIYVGLPLSALLHANAGLVISLVLERGAFGANSVAVTAQILSGMAIGIWGQLIGYAGAKFLTARGRNSGALAASVAGVVCSVAILLLAQPLLGVGVLGVAAAAQGIVFGAFILWRLAVARELSIELISLILLCLLYILLMTALSNAGHLDLWQNVGFSTLFWLASLLSLPWHRRTVLQAASLLRKKTS